MTPKGMAFFHANFMSQTPHEEDNHPTSFNSPILPSWTSLPYHGVAPLLGRRSLSFSGIDIREEINGDDDLSDDGSQAGDKKRRLNIEQVKTLEKSFELGTKLEPERKMQLARALGLQPRQIAIWFQNRRARWKTKQLEKDYDLLKRKYEAIKADNDGLQNQNKKLEDELLTLKRRETPELINLNKETEGSCSNRSENSSDVNLDISRTSPIDSPLSSHPNRHIYPSTGPPNVAQLFNYSSRSDLQCQKIEPTSQDDNLCNVFSGVYDQSNYWPWPEH